MPLSAKTNKPPFLIEASDPQGFFIYFRNNWLPRKEGSSLVFCQSKNINLFSIKQEILGNFNTFLVAIRDTSLSLISSRLQLPITDIQ